MTGSTSMQTPPQPSTSVGSPSTPARPTLVWWKKLILLGFAAGISFLLSEVVIRVSGVVRNVGPSFTEFDAVYGKRVKPNYHCWRTSPDFEMEFTTNSLGHRGPEPAQPPRDAVVFIGDSFTMGYGVSDGDEFPQQVSAGLDAAGLRNANGASIPVVNFGMGHNGNGRWIKYLESDVAEYAPRLVVFQVTGNDYGDNVDEGLYRLGTDGELVEQPIAPPSGLRRLQSAIEAVPGLSYSHLVCFLKQVAVLGAGGGAAPISAKKSSEVEAPLEPAKPKELLTLALIERSFQLCAENGWPIEVLSVAVGDRMLPRLRALCERYGATLFEVPRRADRPDLYFETDGHWNAAGHQFVSEHLVRAIRARFE